VPETDWRGFAVHREVAMYSILSWLFIGLTIGLIARGVIPRWHHIEFTHTMALGVLGAMIGGLISTQIWDTFVVSGPNVSLMWRGWLFAAAGATTLLWAYVVYIWPPVSERRW
jgi:uncharacterized membrane protein YeaQ/YmgE (transglycosylase-associated protein family)